MSYDEALAGTQAICRFLEDIKLTKSCFFCSGKLKSVAFRREQLLALAYLLQENQARFQEAMQRDLGRPPLETSLSAVLALIPAVVSHSPPSGWI